MLKCLINDSCVVHNGHPTHKGMLADIIKTNQSLLCRTVNQPHKKLQFGS